MLLRVWYWHNESYRKKFMTASKMEPMVLPAEAITSVDTRNFFQISL